MILLTIKYLVSYDYDYFNIRLFDPSSTYYIAKGGLDSSTTCNVTNPCYNSSKIDNLTILPGDSVLFNGSQIWRLPESGWFHIDENGNDSNWITYGSYGNGKAELWGSINV